MMNKMRSGVVSTIKKKSLDGAATFALIPDDAHPLLVKESVNEKATHQACALYRVYRRTAMS
jgi:hypothetical protein